MTECKPLLTARELEVLKLFSGGKSRNTIASETGINVRTLDFHMLNINKRLRVNSRIQALLKAKELGLL